MTSRLDLRGGNLDLLVVAGRDAAFVIPTPNDLSARTWRGQVRTAAGALVGEMQFTVDDAQAAVLIPAAVTAELPQRATYDIVLDGEGVLTTLLYGTVERAERVTL